MPRPYNISKFNATLDLPLMRIARGWYVTKDGQWEILYHETHRMWFVQTGRHHPDGEGNQDLSEWFDTLWRARADIYKKHYAPQKETRT